MLIEDVDARKAYTFNKKQKIDIHPKEQVNGLKPITWKLGNTS